MNKKPPPTENQIRKVTHTSTYHIQAHHITIQLNYFSECTRQEKLFNLKELFVGYKNKYLKIKQINCNYNYERLFLSILLNKLLSSYSETCL